MKIGSQGRADAASSIGWRGLTVTFGLLVIVTLGGTLGYMAIEGWGLLDAFSMSVVSSDADNVSITLTAAGLRPDLYIVVLAGEEGAEQKLLRAGASKVVCPYAIGGAGIANAILRPAVVDFIDLVTRREHLELQMEEVLVAPSSPLAGRSILESGVRQKFGAIVVAVKKWTSRCSSTLHRSTGSTPGTA